LKTSGELLGNLLKPLGPEETFKLTKEGTSGQPVGKCKTKFLIESTTNNFATEMTHVGQSSTLQNQRHIPNFPELSGVCERNGPRRFEV
jgi:hypothetical protein